VQGTVPLVERIEGILKDNPDALRTPCFVYDAAIAAERFLALRSALETKLFLSVKANPTVDLSLRLLTVATDGWEVASLKELNLVAANKTVPIFANNPAMTTHLMRAAVGAGAQLVLDHPGQIATLLDFAHQRAIKPVMLRVNRASALAKLAGDGRAPRRDHFGMDWPTLIDQATRIMRSGLVTVAGFHIFGGSNSFARQQSALLQIVPQMIRELESAIAHPLSLVNLGGGFPEKSEPSSALFEEYRAALAKLPAHPVYAHESGRAVFGGCGAFLVRVVATKSIDDQQYFVCDGGIGQDFLLGGTENPLAGRRTARIIGRRASDEPPRSRGGIVVGNSCSQDDVLGIVAAGTGDPRPGDLIAFDDCGAYHGTYPNHGFLGLESAGSYVLS
jgi:diaminopimelate decarboxylase